MSNKELISVAHPELKVVNMRQLLRDANIEVKLISPTNQDVVVAVSISKSQNGDAVKADTIGKFNRFLVPSGGYHYLNFEVQDGSFVRVFADNAHIQARIKIVKKGN